ncbi:MAG TPA: type II toxin-antitoxin system PrlF family antitoxin [Candidatus Binataceae bacterium]|jgi:antitoxin PrlF|nr:type II toxin-antitoxin system PrlF family antitoxin [Candidatus Binataceae bacterium]
MAVSTITSKGQTTIPGEIRRHLKLKPGDRLEFVVEPDGKVVLVPATVDIAELKGMLAPAPRRMSLEEMEQTIRKRGAKR